MREIEFRGKTDIREGKGEWLFGSFRYGNGISHTLTFITKACGFEQVYPETVGQYIGMTDDSGKKIYEGDVVDVVPILGIHFRGVVKFNNHTSAFDVFREEREDSACLKDDFSIEILGNVFDNQEFEKYKEVYFRED